MTNSDAVLVKVGEQVVAAPEGLTFSNVDPGGCDALTLQAPSGLQVRAGAPVAVHVGLSWAWHGRVNDPGASDRAGRMQRSVQAVGYGAALKDDPSFSMVFVDRDLAQWRPVARTRSLALINASFMAPAGPEILPDGTGLPAIRLQHAEQWSAPWKPIAEMLYDAGPTNRIASVYYDIVNVGSASTADASWDVSLGLTDVDDLSVVDVSTGDLWASVPVTGMLTDPVAPFRRYVYAQFYYQSTGGGAQGYQYSVHLRNLAVYGDHGLSKQGAAPQGLKSSAMAGFAVADGGLGWGTVITDSADNVPHAVYREPVAREQVVADMATLAGGWHYGTWWPGSILSNTPVFRFQPPPNADTAFLRRSECQEFQAPTVSVDRLFNRAVVSYRDAAGSVGVQIVTVDNPLLANAGIQIRTLVLDAGIATAASATAYGQLALGLAVTNARGGGSATVRGTIGLTGGGRMPACLLRAGIDRVHIPDLPDAGSIIDANNRRSFIVRRVETTLSGDGVLSTRLDFDTGTDLLAVLTARLATMQTAAGISG